MKSFFTKKIFTFFPFLILAISLNANTVIVSGYVKDVNGVAIANKAVNIYTDSLSATGTSCVINRVAHTNQNGYYIDTINCSATIQLVYTSTLNCNGVLLKNTGSPVLNPTLNTYRVESNFIICVNLPPTNCVSKFTATASNLTVVFNSSQSTATGNNDSIIKRDWSFGDGTTGYVTGNLVNVTHNYANYGTYVICLKITTAKGCTSTYCYTISLINTSINSCKASFNFIVQGKKVSFINTATAGAANTYINSSLWKFGVTSTGSNLGTSTLGNPTFTFPANGNYIVCLKITTTAGCINDTCINVVINDTTPVIPCKSLFSFNFNSYNKVVFNSLISTAAPGDSIIKRDWSFGDSSSSNYLTGNIKDPSHTYTHSGTYTVCLKITTAKGCTSTYCLTLTVVFPPVSPCKSNFYFQTQGKTAYFVSTSTSGGVAGSNTNTIISYLWTFGANTSGGGLAISTLQNPTFTFPANGTYYICLKITTSTGCVSDTCKPIIIFDTVPPVPVVCKAVFVSASIPGTSLANSSIKFNSSNSYTGPNDSIISRHWSFGDSLSTSNYLTGNIVDPIHTFTKAGVYKVCLKITTAKGCTNTACLNIYVALNTNPSNCTAFYTIQPVGYKKMNYNSSLSFAGNNDSIVSRIWNFGDGTTLNGNVVSPVKQYQHGGTYNVCLKITTAKNCINNFCYPVKVIDSATNVAGLSGIKIITLYPNPTFGNISLNVRSSVNGNINATIEVFDVYNNRRIIKTVSLANGNNYIQLNTSVLPQGIYLLKVTSNNGMDATRFIKL